MCISYLPSFGSARFRKTAMIVAMTTGDLPKIRMNVSLIMLSDALACDIPTPSAAESPAIVVFLAVKSCCVRNYDCRCYAAYNHCNQILQLVAND